VSEDTEYLQRISPKLRMIINGDAEVNGHRAVLSAAVQSDARATARAPEHLEEAAAGAEASQEAYEPPSRGGATEAALVSCFVHLAAPVTSGAEVPGDISPSAHHGDLATVDLTPAQVERLSRGRGANAFEQGITYVEAGVPLSLPAPVSSIRQPRRTAPGTADAATAGPFVDAPPPTSPVIVGIIDVGGFDFAHPDFLTPDGDRTRWLAIWDQGADKETATRAQGDIPGVGYGRVLTGDDMDQAMVDAAAAGVAPADFLPQWNQQIGSHGTHVASIAAGNRGTCPHALLAGVSIALAAPDLDRRTTFYDSARLAHAVDFLVELAERHGCPVAINISLGTNGHAHDGTSPISRWIDTALGVPGRCVCVAAGNSGQEAAQFEGDIGHLSGRIHASGRIPAAGLLADLQWQVVGNGIVDVSENEMEIWYRPGDELAVQVRSPSGFETDWVHPSEYYENLPLPSNTFLSVYNERYLPANGANRISVFLSPKLKPPVVGVESGTWTVRLKGVEVRDGRYDAWIERDDPRPIGRIDESDAQAWLFPSYFAASSNVDTNSVSALACGHLVIAVGNADAGAERIHVSSSQGPTWDGRQKPDIAAPGTDIVAARGFGGRDERELWTAMTGTSMASPFVTGVAAQMLSRERRLTSTQILGIMRRTAQPLPGSDYRWQDDAGFGVIQAGACVRSVHQPFESTDKASTDKASAGTGSGTDAG
jgi:subtilisin family serine protease